VKPVEHAIGDLMAESRVRHEMMMKFYKFIEEFKK
jgi:hypothetical protein